MSIALFSLKVRSLFWYGKVDAVKHRTLGILYIGKTRTLRDRFRGGHKALLWAFIEELKATDIRIAFYQLDFLSVDAAIIRVRTPYHPSY